MIEVLSCARWRRCSSCLALYAIGTALLCTQPPRCYLLTGNGFPEVWRLDEKRL